MSNKEIEIYSLSDYEFNEYGRIIDVDTKDILSVANKIEYPTKGNVYIPSMKDFEELAIHNEIKNKVFGELDTQTGYCYGYNNSFNATEWHASSEVNVAVTDMVLFLGRRADIKNNRIRTSQFKAFYVKQGTCLEMFATTLHYCPCQTSENGFGCVVILPKGTNMPLDEKHDNKLLFAKSKWLLAHTDNKDLINQGAVAGVTGKNLIL